ncbi:hypothetical protein ACIQ6Y_22075 [Streptomyces sp. NPDC096205]|uniref:hypothetical protein n=1 Tax=Streptomyces sp. NPDC096205 TaxID=3366081 RepID=UPI0037F60265
MDPSTVAQLAGSALVAAMATDAWQQARTGVVSVWRRVRPEEASAVDAELAEARTGLLADDATAAAGELTALWQRRLLELLLADTARTEELARELHRLTQRLDSAPPAPAVGTVRMHARATDGGRVYQSGRDINITER